MQVAARGGIAKAIADGPLGPAKTVLLPTIVIVGEGMPRRDAGGDIGVIQRVHLLGAPHMQRPATAAEVGFAILPGFSALEIANDLAERPTG